MIDINNEILNAELAQNRLKELAKDSYDRYVDCIYNLLFLPTRIEQTKKEIEETDNEETKKALEGTIIKNEKEIEANKHWMKQYESAIPYLNSLIK